MDYTDRDSESRDTTVSGTPKRFDVLRYHDETHRAVPAGDGNAIITAHETEARQRRLMGSLTVGVLPVVTAFVFGSMYSADIWLLMAGGLAIGIAAGVVRYLYRDHQHLVPEVVVADVSPHVVESYIDDFDPEAVSDPFDSEST